MGSNALLPAIKMGLGSTVVSLQATVVVWASAVDALSTKLSRARQSYDPFPIGHGNPASISGPANPDRGGTIARCPKSRCDGFAADLLQDCNKMDLHDSETLRPADSCGIRSEPKPASKRGWPVFCARSRGGAVGGRLPAVAGQGKPGGV
jgi:hypothetical protein